MKIKCVIKARTRIIEQRVKHPAHGENRGACINQGVRCTHLAHLATGRCRTLQHLHVDALSRQIHRSGQSAHARANDQHTISAHGAASRHTHATTRARHFALVINNERQAHHQGDRPHHRVQR